MSNVTDFKIPAAILRESCRIKKKPFTDRAIVFEEPLGQVKGNAICVGVPQSIGQTLYSIVQAYVQNDSIGQSLFDDESQKQNFLIYVATLLRKAVIGTDVNRFDEAKPNETFQQNLYQRPFAWAAMKNLICPLNGKANKNILLVCGSSPFMDIARYFKEGEVSDPKAPKEEFIFVNDDVDNDAVKDAHILVAATEAHGLSATQVITEMFEGTLYEKLLGLAKLAYVSDEKVEEFTAVLFSLANINASLFPHVEQKDNRVVVAQGANTPLTAPMNWWYKGLIEKMLEPARGPDWHTYKALDGAIGEFWDQVEIIKSRKKLGDGVPFNDLLRLKQLQTTEPVDISQTIQGMLASQRIW